ncbi:MAG: hypothetical protein PHH01_04655 [Patescibacteria group bacterium]|nr:hypothetical protein [Patescibacteria group bacterium]MDD5567456.1 hypothetical protein [Patescibacteria group bacterium]
MALSPFQQARDIIKKSKNILIVMPRDPSIDVIASGLALFLVIEKFKKECKIVCNEFQLPPNANFLPKSENIHNDLTSLRQFIITLDVSRTNVEELSYDIRDKKLYIYITPHSGHFEAKDVSTESGKFAHDLIVVLGATDLDSLGKLYDDHTEFFYQTPTINIDHKAANENFGQVNIVDITATSTSEIVFELIKFMGEENLDEYIATNLLTGIISKTKSFQSPAVTPKSLAVASYLIDSGARRDEIIKNLYQTKSITTLKLWGRTLARLRTNKHRTIVWSLLSADDFVKSGARVDDLPGVIDELIVNTPDAKVILILYEAKPGRVQGIIYMPHYLDPVRILREFHPEIRKGFTKIQIDNTDIITLEQKLIKTLEQYVS